jgi:hypothetical protein
MARIDFETRVQSVHIEIINFLSYYCLVEGEVDENHWYYNINFVQIQEYLVGASKMDRKTLRRLIMDFYLDGEVLYKR